MLNKIRELRLGGAGAEIFFKKIQKKSRLLLTALYRGV
jgi:hypothetical protein